MKKNIQTKINNLIETLGSICYNPTKYGVLMKTIDIQQPISDIFTSRYPKSTFTFKMVNDLILFKSFFVKDKEFVDFTIRNNSITAVKTSNKYLPEVKKLLSINKMKRGDFKIVADFFDLMNSNSNFNKIFSIDNKLSHNEMFSFKKEGSLFKLPLVCTGDKASFFITKMKKSYFRYYFENHFKLTKDGNILLVPVITVFEHQKNEHKFAFNIYNQTIYRVRKEEFYFEDFFENNELFNAEYHGDVFVDEYIDHYVLNELDDDDDIRKELILYPREHLSGKVDLLSMYMI